MKEVKMVNGLCFSANVSGGKIAIDREFAKANYQQAVSTKRNSKFMGFLLAVFPCLSWKK